jgi:hypothetical protein
MNGLSETSAWCLGVVRPWVVELAGASCDRGWQHGAMSLKAFRIACAVVFVAGIVTMIVTSIVSNNMGVMVTTGVLTAVAALVLLAVTAATEGKPFGGITDDLAAERLERRIEALVATGVDEAELRGIVRESIKLGRVPRG